MDENKEKENNEKEENSKENQEDKKEENESQQEKDENKKVENKKEKNTRSISVAGIVGARKVSFAKKSSSDNDVTKLSVQSKRRTRSADFSAAKNIASANKTRRESNKPLFSISEHIDGLEQLSKNDGISDDDTATTDLPVSTTADEITSWTEDAASTDQTETLSELPDTRESSARKHSRSASSVTSYDTSSYTSSLSSSSLSTVSRPSSSVRSTGSVIRMDGVSKPRRTSTQQSVAANETNSRVLRMALRREWTQLELNLRYMNKGDPGIYVADDVSIMDNVILREYFF